MIGFARRCIKVYYRDKSSVLFSLLAVFIVIGLYTLFLRQNIVGMVEGIEKGGFLMDSWMVAGMLAVTSFTTTLGAYSAMVDDRYHKLEKDFRCSPVSRSSLVGGYILSGCAVGLVMSLLALVLSEVVLLINGGELLSFPALCKLLGVILLSVLANSAMTFFVASFLKTPGAFAGASTVFGTLIGFLTGTYIPVGEFPEGVQWVVRCFPTSHAAALMRQIMTDAPMKEIFAGAPAQTVTDFKEQLGIVYSYGGYTGDAWLSILVLAGTAALFFCLALWSLSRKRS